MISQKLLSSAAPIALGLALIATPAYSQTTSPTADTTNANAASGDEGTITVTGSRIARPNLEAPSPVTVVNSEQIALTGTTNLETIINDLPQVIPGNTRVSNNSGGQSFATLDLRGLGPSRTLILLDGERLPSSSSTGVVDISQIPVGLIQRVDVVTGGASATYGSDAIAGVINFILKPNFQGLEVTGQTQIAEDGVGFNYTGSLLVGGNFADNRGNMTLYAQYYDRQAVSQSRYQFSERSAATYYDPTGVGSPVVADNPADVPAGYAVYTSGGSATTNFTQITGGAGGAFRTLNVLLPGQFAAANTDCNAATPGVAAAAGGTGGALSFNDNGVLTPYFGSGLCAIPLRSIGSSRYNFAPNNLLIVPQQRLNVAAIGSYEIDDKTKFKFFASFLNNNSAVNLAPTPATGIAVPVNAVGINADLATALASRVTPGADFTVARRFVETGPRDGRFKTDNVTLRGIVERELWADWKLNVVASYGRVDQLERGIGNINAEAVAQGIRGCRNSAGVVGGPGVLPGCVPVNLFAPLTSAMVNFVRLDSQTQREFQQDRVAANVTGSLFDLPGGPLGVAVGAEYRRDFGSTVVDDAFRRGNVYGFNAIQNVIGSIGVKEVYGEVRAPVLKFVSLEAGYRLSDYTSVGKLSNYKFGGEITPIRQVKLRGSYNKAARAPNVFELFQAGDQGFPSYTDPCRATNTARVVAACVAGGVPAALIPTFAATNSQVQSFAFGNPGLSEEKAKTYTLGAVVTPGRVLGGNVSLTVDYYHIKLTNRVAALGAQFFLNDCYTSGVADSCARIVRDPTSGQVVSINTTIGNSTTPLVTSGVDVGFDWTVRLGGNMQLTVSDVATYVKHYKIGDFEYVDKVFSGIGGETFRYANTLTTSLRTGGFTGQVRYVWKRGPRQNFIGADFNGIFPNGADGRIPDLQNVTLSLRYAVNDHFELSGIVSDVLDKHPPQTLSGTLDQDNSNIEFYDPYALGRTYTMQAKIRF